MKLSLRGGSIDDLKTTLDTLQTKVSSLQTTVNNLSNNGITSNNFRWGTQALAGDGAEGTVTFSSAFKDTNYVITTGFDSSGKGNSDFYGFQIKEKTATGFRYYNRCANAWRGGNFFYIAFHP